ncbi:hypothetical protein TL16_g05346 [Triparma laevis f. inornata]|uniref:Kinesin light chain n=1 Tax=Triparma laevis f. inornata TaxID=1714386 RepID=A0A9W7AJB4_9STRA|nr:hypothetical protein TL16_g05346 [Triparma laevis f. inornata]
MSLALSAGNRSRGFDIGKWQSAIGEHGLWPASLKNLSELASGEGFNKYFRKHFNGNEEAYLRWKEVFDVLEIGNARDVGPDLPLEQQVPLITKSEDLVKPRELAKLCSLDFFNDPSLLVAVWRRILEVLVLAMPPRGVEEKAQGKKNQKKKLDDSGKKLEILDACVAIGDACNIVEDFDDAERYYKRAKEQYEEQLGPDDAKALRVKLTLITATVMTVEVRMEKYLDLLGRMKVAILETIDSIAQFMMLNERYDGARKVWESCLEGLLKVLGEQHRTTLAMLSNLGGVYELLKNYEKALEYHERALDGREKLMGKNHPETLRAVMNTALISLKISHYVKVEELFQRAHEGLEAQLGRDHSDTMVCAKGLKVCLELSGKGDIR